MTDIITLEDGTYPAGYCEEVHVCGNCKHRHRDTDKCKRHEFETEGDFYPEPCDTCAEWRGR
jgi:hypothetical protein